MQQLARAFAETLGRLDPPRPFAVAVSGGPDSTALMHLAAGFKPLVLTVDHGLRPEAAAEAAKVGMWAQGLGLAHEVLRWEGEKPVAGIQEQARAARYRLMTAAAQRAGARSLLTGHTLDDQIETIAMRRGKGSGAAGLAGIPAQALWPRTGTMIVRPLLATLKRDGIDLLNAIGQPFLEDPSNDNLRFDRARLRAEGEIALTISEVVAAQRRRIELEAEAYACLVDHGCGPVVRRDALNALSDAALDLALAAQIRRAGGSDHPGTQTERSRIAAAIRRGERIAGRTLAGAIVRALDLNVTFDTEPGRQPSGPPFWLPFAQYPQLLADGTVHTPSAKYRIPPPVVHES